MRPAIRLYSKEAHVAHDVNEQQNDSVEHSGAATGDNLGVCRDVLHHADRRVEIVPVSQLTPHPRNARTHSRKQIDQLAASIRKFGFNVPILVDDTGEIIAGHGRVTAAKQLKLAAVPALRVSHLSPAEKRAYVIADNKIAQNAGWDRETLAIELESLVDLDFDVGNLGFEVGEIDLLLADTDEARQEAAGAADQAPEPAPGAPVSRPGDLWVCGKHRLLCGDARNGTVYDALLGDEKVGFVFSDPPYNVRIQGHASRSTKIREREFAMAGGEMSSEEFTDFLTIVFCHLAAHCEDGAINDLCIDWRHLPEMLAAGQQAYAELLNVCVWAKSHFGLGQFYRSQHELVFIWKVGQAAHRNNLAWRGRNRTNLWQYPSMMRAGQSDEYGFHPSVKPVALIADAITDCSRRNDLVLDAFMGSGSTLIAAERTGRRARGLEIDPRYVDVTIKRWHDYTGKAATLAATGQTFDEVADERNSQQPAPQAVNQAPSATSKEAA
jgi:DNA modification methylase